MAVFVRKAHALCTDILLAWRAYGSSFQTELSIEVDSDLFDGR